MTLDPAASNIEQAPPISTFRWMPNPIPPNTIIPDAARTKPPHGPRRNHRPGRRRIHRARNLPHPCRHGKISRLAAAARRHLVRHGSHRPLRRALLFRTSRPLSPGWRRIRLPPPRLRHPHRLSLRMDVGHRPRSRTRRRTCRRRSALRAIAAASLSRTRSVDSGNHPAHPRRHQLHRNPPQRKNHGRRQPAQDRGALRPRRLGLCLRPRHHRATCCRSRIAASAPKPSSPPSPARP